MAGLLTAYSVTWTPSKFLAFIAVWSAFSFSALLISSLKLASRSEGLFRRAAIAICDDMLDVAAAEKRLREIADDRSIEGLGPIERAEIMLIFAFRKIPFEFQLSALKVVSTLSTITQIEPKRIAYFVTDVYKVFDSVQATEGMIIVDVLYKTIKESPVEPNIFMKAFESSRHLVLSRAIEPLAYLKLLKESLESGVPPEEVHSYIRQRIQ